MKDRSPLACAVEMEDKESAQELLQRGAELETEIGGKVLSHLADIVDGITFSHEM